MHELNDFILGLFLADENNIIYENIKFSKELTELKKQELMVLPLKFFGPVFLTKAYSRSFNWIIKFIESTISFKTQDTEDTSIIQSMFNLNSSIITDKGVTNLFAIIASPYTEDINFIYKKMMDYIHPSLLQVRSMYRQVVDSEIKVQQLLEKELERGINLIEYSLGSTRKIYWKEQLKYYCVGVIEKKRSRDLSIKELNIYTFSKDDPLRREHLEDIPSYYVMVILTEYYEKMTNITLDIFEMVNVNSNIRQIELGAKDKKVLYLEEYSEEDDIKKSYGVILIPMEDESEHVKNKSFYKKNLRKMLDGNISFENFIKIINPHFILEKWAATSNIELEKIQEILDKKD